MKTIIKVALPSALFVAAVLTAVNLTGSHTDASALRARLAEQPADPSAGICWPLRFYGVRGSGETTSEGNGYGTTVQQFEQTLTGDKMTGLGYLPVTEVEYPAIPFGYAWQDYTSSYDNSVAAGENALQTDLIDLWHQCPSTRVVLAGYSQGAQVAGDVADTLKLPQRARIAAVALFGDPEFNGRQPEVDVAATGYSPHRGGIIVKWPGMHSMLRNVPQDLVPRFHSYCISNDPICNWTAQWTAICWVMRLPGWPDRQICPHAGYVGQQWPKVAAYWAADLIHHMQLPGNITCLRATRVRAFPGWCTLLLNLLAAVGA